MPGTCILCALCVGGSEGDADGEAESDEEEEEPGLVTEVTWVWPECWGVVVMWCCIIIGWEPSLCLHDQRPRSAEKRANNKKSTAD